MIAAAALCLALPLLKPQIVELPEAGADRIVLTAIAPLPEQGERDLAQVRILAAVIPDGTEDYSAGTITKFTSLVGPRVSCSVMPDHVRIQLDVPPGQLAMGISVLDSIMRRASLSDESIAAALTSIPYRFHSYWWEALNPWRPEFARLSRQQILALYKRVFNPERTMVVVGGAIVPGEAVAAWAKRLEGWQAERLPSYRPSLTPKLNGTRRRSITTIDFSGPPFSTSDHLPAQLLAAIALGSGKGSSGFRVWRDGMGVSYRQEAVVWPDPKGLRLRLIAAMIPAQDADKTAENMRKAITEDVDKWNFESLERANGMAEAILLHGSPLSPLYLGADSPMSGSLEDRTFLAGYWQLKTGTVFDARRLLTSMRAVSLEDLQKTAKAFIDTAAPIIVRGSN